MQSRLAYLRVATAFGLGTTVTLLCPSVARAVEVIAVPDLSTRSDAGEVEIPLYDAQFTESSSPRVSSDIGRCSVLSVEDSVVRIRWQPPAGFAGGPVGFQVRYRGADKQKLDAAVSLTIPASPTLPIQSAADPAVAAPDVDSVSLRFVAPPSGQEVDQRSFRVSASFGTVGPVRVGADGVATATWTRPSAVSKPTMAIITVVDEADPRRRGKLELPVQISQSTTFSVPPDALVSVALGDETIGPVQASPAGTVAFDLRLDPRVSEGRLTGSTPHGDAVDQRVALPNSAEPVLQFVPMPYSASARIVPRGVPVAVASWAPPESTLPPPTLTPSRGDLKTDGSDLAGWTTGIFAPPTETGDVTFTATLGAMEAAASLPVEPGLLRVEVDVTPTELTGTKRDVAWTARAFGTGPAAVADRVGVVAIQGTTVSRPVRSGDTTRTTVRLDRDADSLAIFAEPPGSVRDQPVASVLPWLTPVDEDTMVLRIAVTDALGRAIVDQPVMLRSTSQLDGLPATATTDGYGMVHLRLPTPTTTVGIEAHAGGMRGGAGVTASGTPVSGGDAQWLTQLREWQEAAPAKVIPKSKPAAAVAVAATPTNPPTRPSSAPDSAPSGSNADEVPTTATHRLADGDEDLLGSKKTTTREKISTTRPASSSQLRAAAAIEVGSYALETGQDSGAVGPLAVQRDDEGFNNGGLHAFALGWLKDGAIGLEVDGRVHQADYSSSQTYALPTDISDLDDLSGLDAQAAAEAVAAASSTSLSFELRSWELRAGLRYRAQLSDKWQGYGLAHVHRQSAFLLLWDDGEVSPAEVPILGGRLGAGLMFETDSLWLDVQLAESLAPYPVRHEVEARAHYNLTSTLALHVGGGKYWRNMTFEVDDTDVVFHDEMGYLTAGVGIKR